MAKNATQPTGRSDGPITRQKLSDQVFDRLWEKIRSGDLKPGDSIPSERQLMETYAVGRPAVREALQMLANKGVVTISHGERSRVKELSASTAMDQVDDIAKLLLSSEPSNLEHLKQARKLLEAGVVRMAAEHRSDADIRTLRDLVAVQRREIKTPESFIEADIAFHSAIAAATRNPVLQAVTQAMLSWLFSYYQPLLHWSGREDTTLLEHETLVDLLEARDAQAAVDLMQQHLDRSDPLYSASPK